MSDQRYRAGVIQGPIPGRWPESIPRLGPRQGGQPFSRCDYCAPQVHPSQAWSFTRYGGVPLCKRHALALARRGVA